MYEIKFLDMQKLIRIFFTGLFISFLGSLPLGTLNIAAMQIAIAETVKAAIFFSLGSLTAEIIYVRLSLVAMDWVRKQQKILKALEWVTLVIVLALAVSSFYTALHPGVHKSPILNTSLHPYLLGLTMSAVNPVQIPFWMITGTYLITHQWIETGRLALVIFSIGSAAGAFLCLFIYAKSARYVKDKLDLSNKAINTGIAILFFAFAAYHIVKQLYLHVFKH